MHWQAGVCNKCLSLFFEFNFSSCLHFAMVNVSRLLIALLSAASSARVFSGVDADAAFSDSNTWRTSRFVDDGSRRR